MPALWRERAATPKRCPACRDETAKRAEGSPLYMLRRTPDEDPVGAWRLWMACVCEVRWYPFDYDECFRAMGFVAGSTPPRRFHGALFGSDLPSHVARHLYDRLRRLHADAVRDLGWERYFDVPTTTALKSAIQDFVDEQRELMPVGPSRVCFGSRRAAEKRKPRQVRRFKAERVRGDGGSIAFEKEVTIDGRIFLIGFNLT